MRLRPALAQLLGEILRHNAALQRRRVGRFQNNRFWYARRIVRARAPNGLPTRELDPPGAARAATAERVVFQQTQALGHFGREFTIFRTEDIEYQAHAELRAGRKASHWMWFVFPQIEGLGTSAMAQHYAIRSREEAAAYLEHPVLGPRLRECTRLVNAVAGRS